MTELLFVFIRFLYERIYDLYYLLVIRPKVIRLLHRYNRYYRKTTSDKKMFERKVWEFIRENEFIPREDITITLALKIIIASHAIQLAKYLSGEAYDYYDRIIIYKDYYLSRFTKKYHKAEVNPSFKLIVFSIRAIHESLKREAHGTNVMLHEFAHALWLEHKLMGEEYAIFDQDIFDQVELLMERELGKLQDNEHHFLRKYAFTNKAEFFAVAVENFFERPTAFNEALPDLYNNLVRLFRQDPGFNN